MGGKKKINKYANEREKKERNLIKMCVFLFPPSALGWNSKLLKKRVLRIRLKS